MLRCSFPICIHCCICLHHTYSCSQANQWHEPIRQTGWHEDNQHWRWRISNMGIGPCQGSPTMRHQEHAHSYRPFHVPFWGAKSSVQSPTCWMGESPNKAKHWNIDANILRHWTKMRIRDSVDLNSQLAAHVERIIATAQRLGLTPGKYYLLCQLPTQLSQEPAVGWIICAVTSKLRTFVNRRHKIWGTTSLQFYNPFLWRSSDNLGYREIPRPPRVNSWWGHAKATPLAPIQRCESQELLCVPLTQG